MAISGASVPDTAPLCRTQSCFPTVCMDGFETPEQQQQLKAARQLGCSLRRQSSFRLHPYTRTEPQGCMVGSPLSLTPSRLGPQKQQVPGQAVPAGNAADTLQRTHSSIDSSCSFLDSRSSASSRHRRYSHPPPLTLDASYAHARQQQEAQQAAQQQQQQPAFLHSLEDALTMAAFTAEVSMMKLERGISTNSTISSSSVSTAELELVLAQALQDALAEEDEEGEEEDSEEPLSE